MTQIPAITGLGLLTVLGDSPGETWDAMVRRQACVTDHARLELSTEYGSRAATAGTRAARQAIAQAGWTEAVLKDDRTAIVVGTSKGEIEDWTDSPAVNTENLRARQHMPSWGLGLMGHRIAAATGLGRGPVLTLSAACASGLHALIRACLMLRTGEADRVLVVAAEASVHSLFIHSFKRLGVLPPAGHGCRPFDATRAGFVMTEAAAAVCLERNPTAAEPIARIGKYAMAGDASHLTSSDASGAVFRHVLSRVTGYEPLDLVHAHGTGTVVNDPVELSAIDATLPTSAERVPIVSHKAHLGHSLGAAGLVSVVLNCLSHQRSIVLGNPQTRQPLPSERCLISTRPLQRFVRRSVCLAAGFGGSMGAVELLS